MCATWSTQSGVSQDHHRRSHGVAHAVRVRDLAVRIWRASLEAGDADARATAKKLGGARNAERVIIVVALLHDVLDHKYVDERTPSGARQKREVDAVLARAVDDLDGVGAAASDGGGLALGVDQLTAIVEAISYSKEQRALQKGAPPPWLALDDAARFARHCVSDADKIEALGARGLQRCAQYRLERKPLRSVGLNDDATRHPGAAASSCWRAVVRDVADHCDEKLLRLLPEFVRTDAGKNLARPGHAFLRDWRDEARRRLSLGSSSSSSDEDCS